MLSVDIKKPLAGSTGPFTLDISLTAESGGCVGIYGASGAGKTTILRCIAGFEKPLTGRIVHGDSIWFDSDTGAQVMPQERRVGCVFQDYALFPNMTVRGNLEYALRKGATPKRIDTLMEMMEIAQLQKQSIHQLSGGQKQRLALARALASEPQLLLLDEPFAALDRNTRKALQDELLRMQRALGLTMILVSHDVGEIYKLADKVITLKGGEVSNSGRPDEVFSQGMTSGKFRFTGEVLAIDPMDVMVALTILIGQQIVKVVAMPNEARMLTVGSPVMVVSKAFNPMVIPLESL